MSQLEHFISQENTVQLLGIEQRHDTLKVKQLARKEMDIRDDYSATQNAISDFTNSSIYLCLEFMVIMFLLEHLLFLQKSLHTFATQ